MTRVCFVSLNAYKVFNPASSASIGGTELQMHSIARELAKHPEYEVSFIVGDFGQPYHERIGSISVYSSFPLTKRLLSLISAPFILWRILFSIRPHIIISSPAGAEVGILALYAKLARVRYIFRTASDVDCTKRKEHDMGRIPGFLYNLGLHLADQIVTQHEKQHRDLKRYYSRESVVIKNGYHIPTSIPQKGKGEKSIVWIGSSRTVKRPDIFFAAAKHFPEYTFVIILSRSGDPTIYTSCKQKAKKLPNVRFLGELSPEHTTTILKESSVLLGTSDYEGSPNTYISAMIHGIPIVSLHVPCTGIDAHGDVESMYEAIDTLMKNDAEYRDLVTAGKSYAKKYHDMQMVIQDWISVIRTKRYSE